MSVNFFKFSSTTLLGALLRNSLFSSLFDKSDISFVIFSSSFVTRESSLFKSIFAGIIKANSELLTLKVAELPEN